MSARSNSPRVPYIALRVFFCALTLLFIAFIFSQSLKDGGTSAGISLRAALALNGALGGLDIPLEQLEHMLRKAAHFAEFAALGALMWACLRLFVERTPRYISWPLLLGLMVAVADEYIQAGVPGRSSEVADVVLDFAGVAAGLVLGWVMFLIIRAIGSAAHASPHKKE